MKILLTELHCGVCHAAAALSLQENKDLEEFLLTLESSNPNAFKTLNTTIKTICAVPSYRNDRKFKQVKGAKNLFEIKIPGIRLYCFSEFLPGLGQSSLIIAAYGRIKPKDKQQRTDIRHADKIRNDFQSLREQDPEIEYLTIPEDEN